MLSFIGHGAKGSVTAPGVSPIDPRETVDSNGIPVPPKTMVELEKREFKEMWDKSWRKEWDGLNHHDCFLHETADPSRIADPTSCIRNCPSEGGPLLFSALWEISEICN